MSISVATNLSLIRSQIPDNVKLVAVSKTKPVEDILQAYNAGQRLFGENRVQEIVRKKDLLPDDIEWHMIGHLQSNKVKSIVSFISMIQSVDSVNLLNVINSEAAKKERIVDCLLELYIASEETKSGFSMEELETALESGKISELKNIRICGLMGMATFTNDEARVRGEFRYLNETFVRLKERYFKNEIFFREISMGMSGDYRIAIGEGSTMIRVGSLIFGERNTNKQQNG